MPRIFGTPSAKAAAVIQSREAFNNAIRSRDEKALAGIAEQDGGGMGMLDFATLFPGVAINRFNGFNDYLTAGTKKVWATARAVDIIANTVLSTEMKLIWRDPAKNKAQRPITPDKELVRLLQNPNPHDTISEMLYLWVAHIILTGNAYWFKDEMDGYGRPKNVYWLNPKLMHIVPDTKQRVGSYKYRINGKEITFTPDEIMHFRRPNPSGSLFGLGEIESGESLFDEFINRSLFHTRFMANGAMPSSVLVNENYQGNQTDWEKMKGAFMEKYGGVNNAGKVAWLNGKWSLLTMGLDSSALQDLEKSKLNVEQIFLNHGVPLSVAGFGSANYATARVEDMGFRKYAVKPKVELFTDRMNAPNGFVSAFSDEIRLDFALSGLIDVEQIVKENQPLLECGAISPNDFRELLGMPRKPDPFLDQHFIKGTLVPIELAGVSPTDPSAEEPAKKPGNATETSTGDGETGKKPKKEFRIAA